MAIARIWVLPRTADLDCTLHTLATPHPSLRLPAACLLNTLTSPVHVVGNPLIDTLCVAHHVRHYIAGCKQSNRVTPVCLHNKRAPVKSACAQLYMQVAGT